MTPEAVNAWFTPQMYILYLGSVLVTMMVYYQWKWSQVCRTSVLVLVQKSDGHGVFELAPQDGGSVSLRNHSSNTTRMWPLNELVTIDVPYPGVGFVPAFLQKSIRMVLVSETDWEPLTNRSPNMQGVASPDVIEMLKSIAASIKEPSLADKVLAYADTLSTAPTKELIASPAFLGNLMHEKITEAVITVNKEMMDSMSGVLRRLKATVSPTMFYIGIAIVVVVSGVSIYMSAQAGTKAGEANIRLISIQKSLGIDTEIAVPKTAPQTNKPLIPLIP